MRWNVEISKEILTVVEGNVMRIVGEESISMPRLLFTTRIVVDLCMRVAADRAQSSG